MKFSTIASLVGVCAAASQPRVSVSGTKFMYNSKELFLDGINEAWLDYGNDFGNGQPNGKYCALRAELQRVKDNGGHVMRIWVHVEGVYTPDIDSNGHVSGTDKSNTLIPEMKKYLQTA
jgi:mannan endo-1,4-beta-mannosidase